MPNNKAELDTERSRLSLQESSVQYRRIAPSSNSTAPNRPTKLLVDEVDTGVCARLTIHCCRERVAAIVSEIASRIHIETTHRSSIVDENRSTLSMSSLSLSFIDENVTCTAQNRQAYCTSRGIVRRRASLYNEDASSVGFKSVSIPFDSWLFKISRQRRASCLS